MGRKVVIVVLDVVVAGTIALLIHRQFDVYGIDDTNPPSCSNYFGATISCARQDSVIDVVAVAVLCVVLFGALAYQRARRWI